MPTEHESENRTTTARGIHHVTVQTLKWDKSLHLYRDILGMTLVVEFGSPERKVVLLDTGNGSHVELVQSVAETLPPDKKAGNCPIVHFALATSDARAAAERVRQAGYDITMEPKDVDLNGLKATVAFFEGPSGESVEFFETH